MPKANNSYAFSSFLRLKNGAEIKEVLVYGKKYRERNFSVIVKPNAFNYPRLALIIASKHVAKAVDRNRLKRLIRENFRLNQDKIKGNDIIVIGYRGIEKLTNCELRQCLTKNWQKLNLRQEK